MAPTLTPNGAFYTITGAKAVIKPTGTDDYHNIQTVFNTLANTAGAEIQFSAGKFHTSYQLVLSDFTGKISGAGKSSTMLQSGSSTTFMSLLDTADRAEYMPVGVPSLIVVRQSMVGGTATNVVFEDMGFSSSPFEGYTGIAFSANERNIQMEGAITMVGRYPSVMVHDTALALTNTDVIAIGNTNITGVLVYSAAEGQGTKYTETTDYTLDLTNGTITRVGGGAISDGQTVYVTYNNARNRNLIARQDVEIRRCYFKNILSRDPATGLVHGGFCDNTIAHYSRAWTTTATPLTAFTNISSLTGAPAPYNTLAWTRGTTQGLSNTSLRVADCVFEDTALILLPANTGSENVGANYTPDTGVKKRGYFLFERNKFLRCGTNHSASGGFHTLLMPFCSGTVMEVRNNEFINCAAMWQSVNLSTTAQSTFRLPGWSHTANHISITNNVLTGARPVTQAGGTFSSQAVNVNGGSATSPTNVTISGNTFEAGAVPPVSQVMLLRRLTGQVLVTGNKIKNLGPATRTAIDLEEVSNATASNNDFSEFQKAATFADIRITAASTNAVVKAAAGDLIINLGTGSDITGGVIV